MGTARKVSESADPAFFEMGLFSEGERKGAQWIRLTEDPRESPLKLRKVKTNGLAWFEDEMIIHNQDDAPPCYEGFLSGSPYQKRIQA